MMPSWCWRQSLDKTPEYFYLPIPFSLVPEQSHSSRAQPRTSTMGHLFWPCAWVSKTLGLCQLPAFCWYPPGSCMSWETCITLPKVSRSLTCISRTPFSHSPGTRIALKRRFRRATPNTEQVLGVSPDFCHQRAASDPKSSSKPTVGPNLYFLRFHLYFPTFPS